MFCQVTEHQYLPTSSIPTSSIPIWSTSHFINSHFVNSHLVNVDKVGIDKVGIDELGSWQSGNWRTGKLTKWEDWAFYVLLTTVLENLHRTLVPACSHQSTAPQHLPTGRCHQRRTSSNWTCSSPTWYWITPTQTKEKFIAVDQCLKKCTLVVKRLLTNTLLVLHITYLALYNNFYLYSRDI